MLIVECYYRYTSTGTNILKEFERLCLVFLKIADPIPKEMKGKKHVLKNWGKLSYRKVQNVSSTHFSTLRIILCDSKLLSDCYWYWLCCSWISMCRLLPTIQSWSYSHSHWQELWYSITKVHEVQCLVLKWYLSHHRKVWITVKRSTCSMQLFYNISGKLRNTCTHDCI